MGAEASNFQYTVEVPGSSKPGSTPIYLHPKAKPYLTTGLSSNALTVFEILEHSTKTSPGQPFLGTRQDSTYTWKTYQQIFDQSTQLGLFFSSVGIQANENLGIFSKNREEWIIVDLACVTQSIVSVPLYEMLQESDLQVIIEETELKLIACPEYLLKKLIKFREDGKITCLKYVLIFEGTDEECICRAAEAGITLFEFSDVLKKQYDGTVVPPSSNSIFTICYTSGTTGRRKGAMITHSNIISTIAGVSSESFSFNSSDIHLSYLPLAHMMERIFIYTLINSCSSVGFFSGDTSKIKEDLNVLKPTVFISVPRLYNRFYELIIQEFNSATGINRILISKALSSKMGNYHNYNQVNSSIWDKLVLSGVRNTLGGRVRLMATGSAPITGEVLTFLRIVFSCPIIEGYGQTESCAASFLTLPNDLDCGNIGGPIANLEAKLIDVPDMKYFSSDTDESGHSQPRGELCLRGPAVFIGYYKNSLDTQEALDDEGWLHTGDIAIRLSHNGAFKIIDRKKNFFKLAQGEYVAVEKIESVYMRSEFVSQIFVYGDSFQSYLIAVVVPDRGFFLSWADEKGVQMNFEDACCDQRFKQEVLDDMQVKALEAGLYGYEQVKKIYLDSRSWTENDFLTPTFKMVRMKLKMNYQAVIAEMYSEALE
jgi:long-chain acyl-CoA synthetase